MKTKKVSMVWIAVGVVVIVAVAAFLLSGGKKKEEVNFKTEKVAKVNILNSITATGTIEPVNEVTVGTQVSGIVSKLYVDYNSVVKKGQVIAELDKSNLMSQLNTAKAQLSQALHTSPQEMAPDEVLLKALGFLLEKPQVARHIFSSKNHAVMLQYLVRVSELLLERHIALEGLSCTPEDRELILAVCSHALYGMLGQWLLCRKDASLEADLTRVTRLFEGTIHNALLSAIRHPRGQRSQEQNK